jgi:N-acetylneuraminic acid mutarotase
MIRTDAAGHQGALAPHVLPVGYGPADLQAAYQLPSATAGSGATVAIVDAYDDPTAAADLAVYRQQYGLPPCTVANGCFRKIDQRGGTSYPVRDSGWATEISLDLDMVSAICPRCHILLVEADTSSIADLGAAVNQAVAQGAKYVSNSYATAYEYPAETQWDAQYYNHPGVAVTASAGDSGSGTVFPATSPHVVAVGGTSLARDTSSPRGWSETAWSGTGSGCSGYEPKPAWQHDTGCTHRTETDVSAVADPATGVAVYDSYQVGGWAVFGGTSVSSPIIASVYALAGKPASLSYPASYLYAHPSALNDVTSGSNSAGGCSPVYLCTAGPGYDGPTGLGTPAGLAAFQAGPHGTVAGTVTNASTGAPIAGAEVSIGGAATVTDSAGRYDATALAGTYTGTASKYGYATQTVPALTVTSGGTTRQNFTLQQLPTATVTGTVTDASGHGWPLYAQIQVPGTPVTAYTSPVTGHYQLTLPVTGTPYTLDTSPVYPGYQAATTTIDPTAAGVQQDIGLSVDTTACNAPGYQPAYNGYTQTFDGTTAPPGWTVDNYLGGGAGWRFDNPHHRPNYTGGSGGFAFADGTSGTSFNSLLISSPIDLTNDATPVLQFNQDLNIGSGQSRADVELSLDGGKTWTYVSNQSASVPGPDTQVIPLPQAAGHSQVEVGFAAVTFNSSSWEIDNFFVGERSCHPISGGLVAGQVRDGNTGQPVNGASVTSSAQPGQPVTTMPEPADPAVGGGLYWMFAGSSGPQTLTASAGGYSPGTAGVTVTGDAVTRADFTLTAGRLAASPGNIAVTQPMGASPATTRLTVTNTGSEPATVALNTQQGPFTLAGQLRPAVAGAPLRRIKGHFSPRLAATRRSGLRPQLAGALNPAAQPWTTITHYPEYIFDNAAATDPVTGTVYSVGGIDDGFDTVARGYSYNPATAKWTQLPDMAYSRDAAAAAVIGGKLYVTGGYDLPDNINQPALEIYDPRTGLWSAGAPIPHAYYGSTAAVLDGKMYIIGGCGTSGVCTSSDVQVYDPASDSWTAAALYPREISFLACGGISGKLYCAGGFDHNAGQGTTAAYAYDPAANTWSQVASLPIDLWGGGYAAANGQLLVSGGITRFDSYLTNQGFAYDPAANTWTALPNDGNPLYRGGSACGFYRIGGLDASGNLYADAEQLPGYGECGGGTGVPWLSASPSQATLAPGQSTTITLTLKPGDPSITQPGSYTATLRLDGNTPYPSPAVGVTLTVTPPKTWGKLAGTVTGRSCAGTTTALPGATVQVNGTAGGQTLSTGSDGQYGIWLDTRNNPLTLIVTQPGWLAQTKTASVTGGHTTTVNFTLQQASCG